MDELKNKIYEFADFLAYCYKCSGKIDTSLESSLFFTIKDNGEIYRCKLELSFVGKEK